MEDSSPTIISLVHNLCRRTPEIDPVQQEIYDYTESLERRAAKKASCSTIHEKEIMFNNPQEPPLVKILKQEVFELETMNRHLKKEYETLKM